MTSSIVEHPEVRSALDLLTSWIEYQVAFQAIPSIAIAIVHDQDLIWTRAFGHAHVEQKTPATASTLYRIGSVTKLFTATALMQLRDAGVLRLDDPIRTHVPWFSIKRDPSHGTGELTIRHLLTHTSGLPRDSPFPYWADARFPSIEEVREQLANQSTVLPPGERWKYSNLAFVIAGEIVAAASGLPYAEYVERQILQPLGMSDTIVQSPPANYPGLAQGYGRRIPRQERSQRPFSNVCAFTPACGMTSNVLDLAKFAMLQFGPPSAGTKQVLACTTLREMHRVHWLDPDWQAGCGLGFSITREDGRTCVGHGGSVAGHASEFRLLPDQKIAIIVLGNADDLLPLTYAQRATELMVPAIAQATEWSEPAPVVDPRWARYVGRYRDSWGDCQVLLGQTGLQLVFPVSPDPMHGIITLTPVAEHTFRMNDPDGYGSDGELVSFELGPDDKVICMKIGEDPIYPVADW